MSWIVKTPKNTYRANWRDPTGKQRAKTFKRSSDAKRFLASLDTDLAKGTYIDPHAAQKILFRDYADQWSAGRSVEVRTDEKCATLLRTHLVPRWGDYPIAAIDHNSVQRWVAELATIRSPATVVEAFGVFAMVLNMAVRSRLLAVNPCTGVSLPRRRGKATMNIISRVDFADKLLPALAPQFRALACLAAGGGLRWGECAGLSWAALDLDAREVHIRRVAVESRGTVILRDYPKSRAGIRRLPLPSFAVDALALHRDKFRHSSDLVFSTRPGGVIWRSTFRQGAWRPALVQAGMLGSVAGSGPYSASWPVAGGGTETGTFQSESQAVTHIVRVAHGGLRFHDLRHSYATWLVSDGVPVNIVQRLMGHENASTTLNRYVHAPTDYDERVRKFFDDGDRGASGAHVPR